MGLRIQTDDETEDIVDEKPTKKVKVKNARWQETAHDTYFLNRQNQTLKDEIFGDENFFPDE